MNETRLPETGGATRTSPSLGSWPAACPRSGPVSLKASCPTCMARGAAPGRVGMDVPAHALHQGCRGRGPGPADWLSPSLTCTLCFSERTRGWGLPSLPEEPRQMASTGAVWAAGHHGLLAAPPSTSQHAGHLLQPFQLLSASE